jgi:hypothetical protein
MVGTVETEVLVAMVVMEAQPDGGVRVGVEEMEGVELHQTKVGMEVRAEMVVCFLVVEVMEVQEVKAVMERLKVALVGAVEMQGY